MRVRSKPEKTFGVNPDRVDRAKEVLSHFLNHPDIDIWPNPNVRDKVEKAKEKARAQSVQRYTLLIGGVAVFAYVFTHKEQLRANITRQVRQFKVGIDEPNSGLAVLGGEITASRTIKRDGTILSSIEPDFDADTLENVNLDALETVAKELTQAADDT